MRSLTPNQVLAYNVKRLREKRGLNLRQLAEAVNKRRGTRWTKQTVLKVEEYDEQGTVGRKVSMDELVALANVFQVSVIELLLPPDTIKNTATNEIEEVRVDMGPSGIDDWRDLRDRKEYSASAFHFPTSKPGLSTPGVWADLGDQMQLDQEQFWLDIAKMNSQSDEELGRKIEELLPSERILQHKIERPEEYVETRIKLLQEHMELFPTAEDRERRVKQLREDDQHISNPWARD